MTQERDQFNSLAVAWAGVGLAALVALGTLASAYYETKTKVEVTGVVTTDDIAKLAKQGEDLTKSINALNLQIAHMPTTSALENLAARLDQHTGQIADLYNITTGLRHDLDNRVPLPMYRNPRN
ncbi:MAG TPA: hypothetical protein VL614_14830 [Acetobacteraceae bacterium]|jgi:hypothetical protein|nr:hypothetical protein [Acetobacteraceae bacterium]